MAFVINSIGTLFIIAIVYWFWLWRSRITQPVSDGTIDIVVANGIYQPDVITVKRGATVTLSFRRDDPSPCAEQVIFHGLDISETLPIGKTKSIQLTPEKSGDYRFTCQMQMYQGTLKVIDT
jgi:plastocyanin domain-containing protein